MRLFAAVVPPGGELDRLADALAAVDLTRLRPVPRHQWHLTVAFYGEVPSTRVDELSQRLARAVERTEPLTLRLAGAGTFPAQARRARQLWIGIDGDVADLTRLAERAVAVGRRIGLDMEGRRYRPHLTIGRSRRGPDDLTNEVAALSSYAGGSWPVRSLRLVHSTLGAQVRHEVLQDWPLASPERE